MRRIQPELDWLDGLEDEDRRMLDQLVKREGDKVGRKMFAVFAYEVAAIVLLSNVAGVIMALFTDDGARAGVLVGVLMGVSWHYLFKRLVERVYGEYP